MCKIMQNLSEAFKGHSHRTIEVHTRRDITHRKVGHGSSQHVPESWNSIQDNQLMIPAGSQINP